MKKQTYKKLRKQIKKHIHPVNLQIGLYVAVAAVIVTALHTSANMIHAIYGQQAHYADTTNTEMREVREHEIHIGHAQISMARRNYVGGA